MDTQVGIGISEKSSSFEAGQEAAQVALSKMGSEAKPDLVMAFQTNQHDPHQFISGIQTIIGFETNIVGGYAAGIIANEKLGYEGSQCGVIAIHLNGISCDTFCVEGLKDKGEFAVGVELGEKIATQNYDLSETGLIYMYDSVKSFEKETGPEINIGTYLIEGMQTKIQEWPSAAGFGMLGSINFTPTRQFCHNKIIDQGALAIAFHGSGFRMDTSVFHGTRPASDYHTITKADKNAILEIDGQPALEMISKLLGQEETSWKQFPLLLTLGVNHGDKYEFQEENYASRLCLNIDPERKALIMFEPDLVEGSEVQLMKRHVDHNHMETQIQRLMDRAEGRQPILAFYIDCIGRASAFSGIEIEEAKCVQNFFEPQIPFMGIYTGVEIGPVGGFQRPLDWSGVLCLLSRD